MRKSRLTLKEQFLNSPSIKSIRKIKDSLVKIVTTIGSTVKKMWKTAKAVVKTAFKVAKFGVKVFAKAAVVTGKVLKKVTGAITNFAKSGGKSAIKSLKNLSNGGKIVTKIGIRLIKWVGKKLWTGIKKLALAAVNFLKKMFKIGSRFVNTVAWYMGRLGKGINDKAYKFLVKPIAEIMVTVMDFAMGLVKTHVSFSQNMLPNLLKYVRQAINSIKEYSLNVLAQTWSLFKKIMFNPITTAFIVGGLFYFLWPYMTDLFHGSVERLKNDVIVPVKKFVKGAIEILTPIWEVISTVGGWIWDAVAWLTDPDNFIGQAILWIVTLKLRIKTAIAKVMKIGGASSIDFLCMWLAGDTIGMALHFIFGMVKMAWDWLKDKGVVKMAINLVKALFNIQKMIWMLPITLVESILGAGWELVKWITSKLSGGALGGNTKIEEVWNAFTKPWKEWWSNIKDIFGGDEADPDAPKYEVLEIDPVEKNDEVAKGTKTAVSKLGMVGMNGSKTLEKMDGIAQMKGWVGGQNMLKRIKQMEKLYSINSKQVGVYDKFIGDLWKMSNGSDINAQNTLEMLLSSPEFSQKILSVFFYYNPQTNQTLTLRPPEEMKQFVANLQNMMDSQGGWKDKFSMFVNALD